MSELSDYSENAVINALFRSVTLTGTPAYIGLHTADPTDAGGSELPVANGYARQLIAMDAPVNGVTQNSALETFTAAGGAWGNITHVGIYDAATAGNMTGHTPMGAAKNIADGDKLEFAIGSVSITLA